MKRIFLWPLRFVGRALMCFAWVAGESGFWLDNQYAALASLPTTSKE